MAANSGDKWVLVMGGRVLVITDDGMVFAHDVTGNVGVSFQLGGARVAADPEDKWVLAIDGRILVTTKDMFRPTTLNGQVLGRFQGAIASFSDGGQTIYSFLTVRDMEADCSIPEGCALGDDQQKVGGISQLALSRSGRADRAPPGDKGTSRPPQPNPRRCCVLSVTS